MFFLDIDPPTDLRASFSSADYAVNISFDVPEITKQYEDIYTGLKLSIVDPDSSEHSFTIQEYPSTSYFLVNLTSVVEGVHTFKLKLIFQSAESLEFVRQVTRGSALFEQFISC